MTAGEHTPSLLLVDRNGDLRRHAFGAEDDMTVGAAIAALGLVPHAGAIVLRWIEVQHGPYIAFYEVATSDSFVAVALFAAAACTARTGCTSCSCAVDRERIMRVTSSETPICSSSSRRRGEREAR